MKYILKSLIICLFISLLLSDYSQNNNIEDSKGLMIRFVSANPFSFKDIITDLDNQEEQIVSGILKFPSNSNKQKYPLIIGVAGSLGWRDHHYEFLDMYR